MQLFLQARSKTIFITSRYALFIVKLARKSENSRAELDSFLCYFMSLMCTYGRHRSNQPYGRWLRETVLEGGNRCYITLTLDICLTIRTSHIISACFIPALCSLETMKPVKRNFRFLIIIKFRIKYKILKSIQFVPDHLKIYNLFFSEKDKL